MCGPVAVAAAAVAVAAVGAGVSYAQGQSAASAAADAQEQSQASQNTAFNSRMEAQRASLAAQTEVNTASAQRFQENQAAQQADQVQAMNDRQTALTNLNVQQAATSDQANQAITQGVQAVSGTALPDAQAAQAQAQTAMTAPQTSTPALQASNPLGALNTGVTKSATDASEAAASKNTQQYASSLAKLSSYSAPTTLANQTATTIGTNLMPAQAADQLVRTGAPALLAPGTLAYQQAGQYGSAVNSANQLTTAMGTTLEQTRAQNAIDLANLTQGDDAAAIQSKLNLAQAQAAAGASLGTGLSALGAAGISYAGAKGAFSTTTPAEGSAKAIQ